MTVVQRAESVPDRPTAVPPEMPAERSLPALLLRNAERHAARPAFREKRSGIWRSWTWAETRDEVVALAQKHLLKRKNSLFSCCCGTVARMAWNLF